MRGKFRVEVFPQSHHGGWLNPTPSSQLFLLISALALLWRGVYLFVLRLHHRSRPPTRQLSCGRTQLSCRRTRSRRTRTATTWLWCHVHVVSRGFSLRAQRSHSLYLSIPVLTVAFASLLMSVVLSRTASMRPSRTGLSLGFGIRWLRRGCRACCIFFAITRASGSDEDQ